MTRLIVVLITFAVFFQNVLAQEITELKKAQDLLNTKGEVHLVFDANSKYEVSILSGYMSIDKVVGNRIFAYLSKQQFEYFQKLNYSYKVLETQDNSKAVTMATTIEQMGTWNRYPTHDVYMEMMNKFAATYPTLCKMQSIGRSVDGRDLLVLKISDNVQDDEAEPEVFYTATMHGDELLGYILMLRLADSLLKGYTPLAKTNNLVDNFEIYINPLANPDGTYSSGNSTISYPTRYNSNSEDLNRDFFNFNTATEVFSEKSTVQPETKAMINFAKAHNFVLSANIHGGIEVVNFPWDVWTEGAYDYHPHPDNKWFSRVSRAYATSAQQNSPAGYIDDLDNGITCGADWYYAYGTRQDYMNYFRHCREITLELHNTKELSASLLPAYWKYNKNSLINYIKEAAFGINGFVTDTQGNPLSAKVEILQHDLDNSYVTTEPTNGDYYRPIESGVYDLKFSAEGYKDKIVEGVTAVNGQATRLDVELEKVQSSIVSNLESVRFYPNPIDDFLIIETLNSDIQISDIQVFDIFSRRIPLVFVRHENIFKLNTTNLSKGNYFCKIIYAQQTETIQFIKL